MPLIDDLGSEADRSLLDGFHGEELDSFYRFLKEKNEVGGFFSAGDAARIADRHLFESLAFVRRIMSRANVSRETKILDAGSGPGLPGYLFTCLNDPPYVTLLDSSRRRLSLVEEYHKSRSLSGRDGARSPERIQLLKGRLRFQYARAEESRGEYDIVTARALIPFPFNAVLLRHLVKGQIMLSVGPSPLSEDTEKVLQRYGLVVEESCRMTELDFLGERNLLILRKKNRTVALPPVLWKTLKGEMDQWRKS